jgi:hypothetical protein
LLAQHPLARVEQAIVCCHSRGTLSAAAIVAEVERLANVAAKPRSAACSVRDIGMSLEGTALSDVQVPAPDLTSFNRVLSPDFQGEFANDATTTLLLKANLKQLKMPTMSSEFEKLAREASAHNEAYEAYLLRLTEVEVAARSANALTARIRAADFPVAKDFDTYDFSALPSLPKQKLLELARGEWIEQRFNCCLIGNAGTGKTHVAISLGLAACRQGKRVRFFTAAGLVNQLEEAQQQHRLDRFLSQLERTDLLICD